MFAVSQLDTLNCHKEWCAASAKTGLREIRFDVGLSAGVDAHGTVFSTDRLAAWSRSALLRTDRRSWSAVYR